MPQASDITALFFVNFPAFSDFWPNYSFLNTPRPPGCASVCVPLCDISKIRGENSIYFAHGLSIASLFLFSFEYGILKIE